MESLTKHCMAKLNEVRQTYDFENVKTGDRKILFKDEKHLLGKLLACYD